MTSIIIGEDSGKIWAIADSRITAEGADGKTYLTHDRAPKILKIATQSAEFGFAYAGTSIVGYSLFLALAACQASELAENAEGIATQVIKLLNEFESTSNNSGSEDLESGWRGVGVDILVFGENQGTPSLFRVTNIIGQKPGKVDLSKGPRVYGDRSDEITAMLYSSIARNPSGRTRDTARAVLGTVQADGGFPGIGGLILECEVNGQEFIYCANSLIENYVRTIS